MLSNLLLIERTDTNVSRDKQFSVFTVCIYDSFLSHCKTDKSKRADLKVRTCCLIYLKTTEPCIKEQSEIMISNGLVNSFMHIMYSTMLCFISCTLWSAPQEFRLCIVSCVIPTLQQFSCPHHILLFKGLELIRFLNVLKEVCIYSALLNKHHLLTFMSFLNLYNFLSYVEHKRRYFTEIHHRRHFYFFKSYRVQKVLCDRNDPLVKSSEEHRACGMRFALGRWHSALSSWALAADTFPEVVVKWHDMSLLFTLHSTKYPWSSGLRSVILHCSVLHSGQRVQVVCPLICPDDRLVIGRQPCRWRSLETGLVKDM